MGVSGFVEHRITSLLSLTQEYLIIVHWSTVNESVPSEYTVTSESTVTLASILK